MSTLKITNLQNASAASPAIVLDANSRATLNGLSYPTEGSLSGRNRIINGDMRIDQRNAGASVSTSSSNNIYTLDRFQVYYAQTSKFTVQQNAGSVTPPTGFTNYLGITSSSAYSSLSGDYFFLRQHIEGFNTGDLAWGTANASSVVLSFRVYSSLTGTFSGVLRNSAEDRTYAFTYSVSSANTWTTITIPIAGPTTGTWLTNSGTGIQVMWDLGSGSTGRTGTTGSWVTGGFFGATGSVSVVGTNGATFYITGVQLEAGSVATPFERRSYGQELALCQRYCLVDTNESAAYRWFASGYTTSTTGASLGRQFPVTMRVAPSITASGTWLVDGPTFGVTPTSVTDTGAASRAVARITVTASSGYVASNPVWLASDGTTNLRSITYSAEL